MKDEYVVINKKTILKRIEELKKDYDEKAKVNDDQWCSIIAGQIIALKQTISQSTPLIPEIEKAFDAGRKLSNRSQLYTPDFYWTKENYISNLKLNI